MLLPFKTHIITDDNRKTLNIAVKKSKQRKPVINTDFFAPAITESVYESLENNFLSLAEKAELFCHYSNNKIFLHAIRSAPQYFNMLHEIIESNDEAAKKILRGNEQLRKMLPAFNSSPDKKSAVTKMCN